MTGKLRAIREIESGEIDLRDVIVSREPSRTTTARA